MIPIDPKTLEGLARRFSPVLRFHERERFFPLLVESWLTTTSAGVWPEHPDRAVHLRTGIDDQGRRGAAVLTADRAMTALEVLCGPPVGGTRPIGLGGEGADPYSLLGDAIRRAGPDAFLDVGGWHVGDPRGQFVAGDLEQLARLCSELASAMTPGVPWNPPQDRDVAPWAWVAQPTHPTMYCEISWAGSYPRVARAEGNTEFPSDDPSLHHRVAFTYHLFYGAREAPEGARHSEGQWEAITLFFDAELKTPRDSNLVREGLIAEEPSHVVISQGQDRGLDGHFTELEDWPKCEKQGTHPVIYVARGTHRNHFRPVAGQTFDPGAHPPFGPGTVPHADGDDSWIGVDGFLAAAGVLLGLAVLFGAAAAIIIAAVAVLAGLALVAVVVLIVVAVLLIIAAIVLFIMWIVSACDESSDEDAGETVTPSPAPEDAGPGGPQAGGGGSEEPAPPGGAPGGSPPGSGPSGGGPGGGSGPGGASLGTVGLPNTGSPTGRESSWADVRIVERLIEGGASKAHTSFPTDRVMENPAWWHYRGRWGVRVRNLPGAGTWESGWHRVDERGRDWPYFAAERLVAVLNGGPRSST